MFEEIFRNETAEFTRDDPPSVIVNPVDAIAVYRNGDGGIVIRQRRPMASEDPYIVIPLVQAENVIEAIRREMKAG